MSVLQDGELEYEALDPEFEGEPEDEGEEFLGGLLKGLGSALGLGEGEDEYELEDELALEGEDEQFLPFLAPLAKLLPVAAKAILPHAAKAIGGLFGGRRQPPRRREAEDALEMELEAQDESPAAPLTRNEAIAQTMAAAAAKTPSSHEAEAFMGAATVMMMTPREQAALQRLVPDIIPKLVQVNCILTRLARRRRVTRPVVRLLPTAVTKATVRPLVRVAASGQRVTPAAVGRVVRAQTRRALTQPQVAARALQRNQLAVRRVVQQPRARRGALVG